MNKKYNDKKLLLAIYDKIKQTFTKEEWRKLTILTGMSKEIDSELSKIFDWGNIYEIRQKHQEFIPLAVDLMIKRNRNNFKIIMEHLGLNVDETEFASPKSVECKTAALNQSFTQNEEMGNWANIEKHFNVTKKHFGKKINFVKNKYTRKVIFRDIAHAFHCYNIGFYKPSVLLSGGVIEEMIRCFLEKKHPHLYPKKKNEKFYMYIEICIKNKLLQKSISGLSNAIRDFRNLAHIKKEKSNRYAISKSIAIGAISAIFSIANDFT